MCHIYQLSRPRPKGEDMDIMVIVLIVLLVITPIVASFNGKIQGTTLYVGKLLGEVELARDLPNGYQDAITPGFQTKLNLLNPVLWLGLLIIGSIIGWWLGIVAVIVTAFNYSIIGKMLPKRLGYYVMILMNDMNKRTADYLKNGDKERAKACKLMAKDLTNYYLSIKDIEMPVPDFKYSKNMPVGGYVVDDEREI